MDHQKLIPIESRTGHGRRAADLDGECMGSIPHEDKKLQHLATTVRSWEELGGVTLQRQKLDTNTCLLVICCLAALLFGAVNVLHTRI